MTEPQNCPFAGSAPPDADDEIDLGHVFRTCLQHRRLIASWTVGITLAAVLYSLYQPNVYRATTSVVVPDGKAADLYIQVLKSRHVAEAVVKKCGLERYYAQPTMDQTIEAFVSNLEVQPGKATSIISISFPATSDQSFGIPRKLLGLFSPERERAAAEFAAAVVGAARLELDETVLTLLRETSAALRERDFLEKRFSVARSELTSAEARLGAYKQRAGALAPQPHGDPGRGPAGATADAAGVFLPLYLLPAAEQEFTTLVRDAVVKASLHSTLRQQYEQATIAAARELAPLRTLDEPVAPAIKWRPRRGMNCALALFLGLLAGLAHVCWRQFGRKMLQASGGAGVR